MFSFRTEVEIVKFFGTNKYFLSFKCMTAAVLPSGESVFFPRLRKAPVISNSSSSRQSSSRRTCTIVISLCLCHRMAV